MKNCILSICSLLLVVNMLPAQTVQEALSLSTSESLLSARQTAMGGASGALFSEIGAIAVNPAILGTYQTSEVSFTPLYYNRHITSNYLNHVRTNSRFGFVLGSAGIVYSIQPRQSGLRYNLAFTYNRKNNFSSNNLSGGSLPVGQSLWQELANNVTNDPTSHFNSELIARIPMFNKNGDVYSPIATNIGQTNNLDIVGNVGEYALSFGMNLTEMLNIGVSVVLREARMSNILKMYEEDTDNPTGSYYNYHQQSETKGLGLGGKIGITLTPQSGLNFGLSVHSPVYYSLTREEEIRVTYVNQSAVTTDKYKVDYNLLTPIEFVLSASYDIMGRVLLSLDYEGAPYTMTRLSNSGGTSLDPINEDVKQSSFVSNIRFGTEILIWRGLSARAGGGYLTAIDANDKGSFNIAGGLGYRFGEASIDATYSYTSNKSDLYLYQNAAPINTTMNESIINISLSYRF